MTIEEKVKGVLAEETEREKQSQFPEPSGLLRNYEKGEACGARPTGQHPQR